MNITIPKAAMAELLRRENAGGGYRTRQAASILCEQLIGGITLRDGSVRRTF
jgi:hypothetical protein